MAVNRASFNIRGIRLVGNLLMKNFKTSKGLVTPGQYPKLTSRPRHFVTSTTCYSKPIVSNESVKFNNKRSKEHVFFYITLLEKNLDRIIIFIIQ